MVTKSDDNNKECAESQKPVIKIYLLFYLLFYFIYYFIYYFL